MESWSRLQASGANLNLRFFHRTDGKDLWGHKKRKKMEKASWSSRMLFVVLQRFRADRSGQYIMIQTFGVQLHLLEMPQILLPTSVRTLGPTFGQRSILPKHGTREVEHT